MIKNARISALALIIGVALVLGACGSKDDGDVAGATANVTFTSSPNADIWIDGKASGTTPLTLALSAGSHKIAMKRNGFVAVSQALEVEAGKDITVDGALPVRGEDEAAFRRLLAMIDTEYVPFDKATTHRGGGSAVTLYYPSGDVRRTGLSTYRVEVSSDYDAEGYIEFRKGKKVLYREKFEPEAYITEKALPAEVLEAARNGAKLSWGLTYDSKRRKRSEVKAKFSVIGRSRERKIEKRIDRTMDRRATRSASPLLREMTQIRLLVDQRLYSEALMRSLAVLNTWENTELPYRNMASALQRLKLKDSSLYQFVASKLLGGGGKRLLAGGSNYLRPNEARQGSDRNNRSIDGGNAAHDSAGKRSKLPVIAVAPKSKSAGASGGMQPQGFGVTPTDQGDQSSASAPGSAPGEADAASASSDTGVRAGRGSARDLARLRKRAEEAELRAAEAEQAERDLAAIEDEMAGKAGEVDRADEALALASEAADQAQRDADTVAADPSATQADKDAAQAAIDAAKAIRDTASDNLEALRTELNEMETNRPAVEEELRKIVEKVGSSAEASAEAARLRESLAQAEQAQGAGDSSARASEARSTEVSRLRRQTRAAESRAADAVEAEKALTELHDALDSKSAEAAAAEQANRDATEATRMAQEAAAALVASGTATPEELAAAEANAAEKEAERVAASDSADALRNELALLEGGGPAAEEAANETLKRTGTSELAAEDAARLRKELAEAEAQTVPGTGTANPSRADRNPSTGGNPGTSPVPPSAPSKGHVRKGGLRRQPLSHQELVQQATGMQQGAQSDLEQARAAQEGAEADVGSASVTFDEAQIASQQVSETELPAAAQERDTKQQAYDDLVATGTATQDQLDTAKAEVDAAQAGVDQANAALDQAQQDSEAAEANVARAMIELERANASLTRAEQDLQEADRKLGELGK